MMKCYEMFELSFQGEEPKNSQAEVIVNAEFINGDSSRITVKGFYDGNGIYKVRFLPEETGMYQWKISGIIEAQGEELCELSDHAHGKVVAIGNHFAYQDGAKYLPVGTTIYAMVNQEETRIQQTLDTIKDAPFNKIRHCIFPKDYDYNHNEPQFYPFEKDEDGNWDVHRPCFAYWQHLEGVMGQLGDMGIENDLILFHAYDRWGFSKLSKNDAITYIDYAIRRLSAFPNLWWSLANEYDLVFQYTTDDWYDMEEYIAKNDPFEHLLSNHNGLTYYDFTRPNITHCCFQTTTLFKAGLWQREYKKPVIFDEMCYEGNIGFGWGNISGFEMVNRFWKVCTAGAYATHGETYYNKEEVLWWSKGGCLKGESPERIDYLKEILYGLPGYLEPWEEGFSATDEPDSEHPLMQIPFFKAFFALPLEVRKNFEWPNYASTGKIGDDVFVKYFAEQQTTMSSLMLPEDKNYKIDLVDVWNMTRETLIESASGITLLRLPGRRGMAIIATRKI